MISVVELIKVAVVQPPEITIAEIPNGEVSESLRADDAYLNRSIEKFEELYSKKNGEVTIERSGNVLKTDRATYISLYSEGIEVLGESKSINN